MVNGITTEPVIVGIDPGTTSAVAILDLEHNLKGYKSSKNFSKDQIIRFIISHGKPLIIATDVANAPSLIEDISANMGAIRFAPNEDLQAQYKEDLTDQFAIQDKDAHTMDATAAAEYAYREYEDKLNEILGKAEDSGLERSAQFDVVELVLKGTLSVSAAINEVNKSQNDPEPEDTSTDERSDKDWERIAQKRKQQIDQLNNKVDHLEEYKQMLEKRISEVEQENDLDSVDESELRKRNRLINRLRSELGEKKSVVQQLQEENKTLEISLERVIHHDWIYVPKVENLRQTSEDIVYGETYSGGTISNTLDTVITGDVPQNNDAYKSLKDKGVSVITVADLREPIQLEHGYVVHPEDLRNAASAPEDDSERFIEWLDSYKKRQKTS